MEVEKIRKDAFCVIGKAGSTRDGDGFVGRLWQEANSRFGEVADLAKRTDEGNLVGVWGAMTDFSFAFQPWEENFSQGLYLAGVEAREDAAAPRGWKKWIIPGFTYLKVRADAPDTFEKTLAYMAEKGMALVGAVQDFTDPASGVNYMLFPVEKNDSKERLIREIKDRTDQVSVCTHHCEHCFLGRWCGGCRSACDVCSFATLSEDNLCANVRCAREKGLDSCAWCDGLLACGKGFYGEKTGHTPKATALFVRKNGKDAYSETLEKAIRAGFRYTEDLDACAGVEEALAKLEQYR